MKLLEAPVEPEHPIDFIRDNLGPTNAEKQRVEGLEQKLVDYKQEISDLKSQIDDLKEKLNKAIVSESPSEVKTEVAESTTSATTNGIVEASEIKIETEIKVETESKASNDDGGGANNKDDKVDEKVTETETVANSDKTSSDKTETMANGEKVDGNGIGTDAETGAGGDVSANAKNDEVVPIDESTKEKKTDEANAESTTESKK